MAFEEPVSGSGVKEAWNFPVEITNDDDYFENAKIDSGKLRGNWTILFFFTEFDENANEVLSKVKKSAQAGEYAKLGMDHLNFLAISNTPPAKAHELFCQFGGNNKGLKDHVKAAMILDRNGAVSKEFNIFDFSQLYTSSGNEEKKNFPSYVFLDPDLKVVAKFTPEHNVPIDPKKILEVVMPPKKTNPVLIILMVFVVLLLLCIAVSLVHYHYGLF